MRVEISGQLVLFFASFVCGCLLSLFYDLIRLGRMTAGVVYGGVRSPQRGELSLPLLRNKPHPTEKTRGKRYLAVLVFLGDILFFAVAAFALLCVFFNYGGKVRGMGIFLAAVGFLLCHYTVGAVTINIFALVKLGVGILFEYLLYFLMLPVRKLFLPLIKKVLGAICGTVKRLLLRLYTKKQERKMLSRLCGLRE